MSYDFYLTMKLIAPSEVGDSKEVGSVHQKVLPSCLLPALVGRSAAFPSFAEHGGALMAERAKGRKEEEAPKTSH